MGGWETLVSYQLLICQDSIGILGLLLCLDKGRPSSCQMAMLFVDAWLASLVVDTARPTGMVRTARACETLWQRITSSDLIREGECLHANGASAAAQQLDWQSGLVNAILLPATVSQGCQQPVVHDSACLIIPSMSAASCS